MTKIKICGITRLADACCAAQAGADYLGFIFYPRSARYIDPAQAGELVGALRAEFGPRAPALVGVFVNASVIGIRATIAQAGLDLVQLHGDEPPSLVEELQPHAFKALRPRTLDAAQRDFVTYADGTSAAADRPDLLIDAHHPTERGGTGHRADLAIAAWLAHRCHLLLAGGLAPENVRDAIIDLKPWGVDVSSGVEESKGIKDHRRVRSFVQAVRLADRELQACDKE